MGAVAITTLAGARLIPAAPESRLIGELSPFLKGFTLFFWAAGTWWIPLLLVLGFRRHLYKRFPLRYDPQYCLILEVIKLCLCALWWFKAFTRSHAENAIKAEGSDLRFQVTPFSFMRLSALRSARPGYLAQ